MRRRLWFAAASLLVVGCSGAGGHSSAATSGSAGAKPSATPAHAKPPAGWARTDLTPVTMPQLAGGRLVFYAEGGGGIQVVGLDPNTGKTVWRDNASPGDTTPGVSPTLGVAGSTVAFLSPVDNKIGSSQLVGVDAATGRRLWHTPTGAFEDWPAPCSDAPSDICTTGSFNADQALALRFRASDGAQVGAAVLAYTAGGREVGPDLYDPAARDPEVMEAVSGSSVAWIRPLASVFSSKGESTDWGWNFDRVPAAGLFVGSVGGPPVSYTATSATVSIARAMTAGFRISDGSVAWQDPGTEYMCRLLPCPGQGQGGSAPTLGLRLRVTGTATTTLSDTTPKLSPGGYVTIEGFDLATGKTRWSYDAGPDGALMLGTLPVLSSEVVAVPLPSGDTVALNLATGEHEFVSPESAAWCGVGPDFKTQVGYPSAQGGKAYERSGFSGYRPCDALGDYTSGARTVPSFAGITVDGLTVTSNSSEVAAVPAGSA
ncbi:MAG TPA: PQQ-binding-like beta-propeller repeat protein [Trebonia sp.]|nr:PQQ-binding-like beta-propeller repeat protein [Trebonia sp.]